MHHVHHALSSATIVALMHAPITLAIVRFSRHRLSVLYDELEQKVRQPSISCLLCSHTICIKSTANTTLPPSNMESAWKTELGSKLVCRMAKSCRCNRHRRTRCANASLCRCVLCQNFGRTHFGVHSGVHGMHSGVHSCYSKVLGVHRSVLLCTPSTFLHRRKLAGVLLCTPMYSNVLQTSIRYPASKPTYNPVRKMSGLCRASSVWPCHTAPFMICRGSAHSQHAGGPMSSMRQFNWLCITIKKLSQSNINIRVAISAGRLFTGLLLLPRTIIHHYHHHQDTFASFERVARRGRLCLHLCHH